MKYATNTQSRLYDNTYTNSASWVGISGVTGVHCDKCLMALCNLQETLIETIVHE